MSESDSQVKVKVVPVTRAQVEAAKLIRERNEAAHKSTAASVTAIAEAATAGQLRGRVLAGVDTWPAVPADGWDEQSPEPSS